MTAFRRCCFIFLFLTAFSLAAGFGGLALADQAAAIPPGLELVVLGSGGPGAVGRAGSCHLILVDGEPKILVDAGPGSFVRLGETGLSLENVDLLLLTHLHADHAGELPGLIKARAVAVRAPIHFEIFGPEGAKRQGDIAYFPSTSQLVRLLFGGRGAFAYLPDFAGRITFEVKDLQAQIKAGQQPTIIYDKDNLIVRAIAGHHRDAPAIIYRIEHAGKSITFSGDIDASGLDNLRKIAEDTTLLVFNSAVLDPPLSPPILYTLHSPPGAIGRVAGESRAQSLLLAHLSPATDQRRADVETSIRKSYAGPIIFAEDKFRIVP